MEPTLNHNQNISSAAIPSRIRNVTAWFFISDISRNASPRLNIIVGRVIISRYSKYAIISTLIFFDIIFIISPIPRIIRFSPRNSLIIPQVLPSTYSKFEIERV